MDFTGKDMGFTRTQMQDKAAEAAEAGNRYESVYWSSLSHGDTASEALAAARAAVSPV